MHNQCFYQSNMILDDVSRVHLKQIDDDDNSSYINASFVDVSWFCLLFTFTKCLPYTTSHTISKDAPIWKFIQDRRCR